MTEDIVISVKNVTKTYRLFDSHADRVKETFHPFRKKYHHPFNALSNVSFDVRKGETLGIIGQNGSGKSTLLQIVCGILQPTSGNVEVNGRVSALLELGTGFNPEFTGIENVYLNGSIMGYSNDEMNKKLDDIVSFADIGDFVYQPVKTYSSGMYVRLAFAVAINVDPHVLVVDEALSVGDIAFRNKCMSRIKDMRDRGTNILFVSHDLSTLQIICHRVVWLDRGQIVSIGDPIAICQEYYAFMTRKNLTKPDQRKDMTAHRVELIPQQNTGMGKFIEFKLDCPIHEKNPAYDVGQDITFKFSLFALQALRQTVFAISIYRADGDFVVGQTSREADVFWSKASNGEIRKGLFVLNPNCLAPGDYRAAFGAYSKDLSLCYALTETTVSFSVRSDFPTWGKFLHPCKWTKIDDTENDG